MELILKRKWFSAKETIGELWIGEILFCYTLEDTVREPGMKLAGATAIPAGRYRIAVTQSPRFQRKLPLLFDVPNFAGIRIHGGNTHADTEGCILVGEQREDHAIRGSARPLGVLIKMIEAETEPVWITVTSEKAND